MAVYRIWPATSGAADTGDYTTTDLGLQFHVTTTTCTLTGYYWWLPATDDTTGTNYSFRLYSTTNGTTGTLLSGPKDARRRVRHVDRRRVELHPAPPRGADQRHNLRRGVQPHVRREVRLRRDRLVLEQRRRVRRADKRPDLGARLWHSTELGHIRL